MNPTLSAAAGKLPKIDRFLISALTIFTFSFPAASLSAQTSADTLRKDALRVFMETTDFLRREIPYVNYVRDIKDAQVYIISSSQLTGSGGREYSYFVIGQERFTGMKDTLVFRSSPDDTEDQVRNGQVKVLKQGLMRYVMGTPLAQHIEISFTEPLAAEVTTDKWNSWVFSAGVSGMLDGQKTYNSNQIFGTVSARRITSDWKIDLDLDYQYNLDKFLIDEQEVNSINSSRSFETLIVRSIGDHWSVGGETEIESSTYRNYKLKMTFMPGIEYDIYPYSESTRKQLRILYSAGFLYQSYADTTIYDKMQENLWGHSLQAAYKVVQKWGSVNLSLDWFNYMHDWSKNNLSLDGGIEVRLAKGLSLQVGGGAAMIHDQLALVKGGATREEILLRRKELATVYSYFTYFGLSYTFGSIYNNVVNPRFGGSSGGMTISIN
jgi:hypothetical protein